MSNNVTSIQIDQSNRSNCTFANQTCADYICGGFNETTEEWMVSDNQMVLNERDSDGPALNRRLRRLKLSLRSVVEELYLYPLKYKSIV